MCEEQKPPERMENESDHDWRTRVTMWLITVDSEIIEEKKKEDEDGN